MFARIGSAVAAPRRALAYSVTESGAARVGTDAMVCIAFTGVVLRLPVVIAGFWSFFAGGDWGVVFAGLIAATHAALPMLAFYFAATAVVFALGASPRTLSRASDMASVAVIAMATVWLATVVCREGLELIGGGWGMLFRWGWAVAAAAGAVVVVVAVVVTRAPGQTAPPTSVRSGVVVLCVALAAAGLQVSRGIRDGSIRPVMFGEPAPLFTLPAIGPGGSQLGPMSLAGQRGRVVVLDFWATWCGPCRRSLPSLERVSRNMSDLDVDFYAVNTEGGGHSASARQMLDSLGVTVPMLVDGGAVSNAYRAMTIPHLVVVDRAGNVAWIKSGTTGAGTLESKLRAIVGAH